jgi:hypothetical protein
MLIQGFVLDVRKNCIKTILLIQIGIDGIHIVSHVDQLPITNPRLEIKILTSNIRLKLRNPVEEVI